MNRMKVNVLDEYLFGIIRCHLGYSFGLTKEVFNARKNESSTIL
jgi:hypothetical protein